MSTDPNDTSPEDVEAHRRHFFGTDQSQAGEQGDTGQDVEAHGRYFDGKDDDGEDVEAHRRRFGGGA